MSVMIVTSLGEIVVDLFTDRCPLTCKNFLKLCKIKYYNGCLFHTVQKDFTAQTGDPTGTGSGGDSVYKFLYGDQARFFGDEIHLDLKHTKTGTVAMASAGENLNASQFYITLRDDLDYLDGKHSVFGEVAEGLETLTRINEAYVDENGRPYKNIRIKHTYILEDPFDDPSLLAELIPDASPEGKPKDEAVDDVRLEDDWVPIDEQLGHGELEEVLREKVAHSSAVVLESIGDIPDAEIKPPDNVLFVCKLNPVTEDEDLLTIFSRFGTVTSAEVIRDYKTGDSLCYAFIEFEDKEACEQAYFKMDNALIDDRRIHVDFSQSVAKLWSQYRRKGQKGTGGGCFKCGSLDHFAKDCPGDSTTQQQRTKYILKDSNTQRGGDDNSRYEMVFAEDAAGSPRRNKKRRDHEDENIKRSIKRDDTDDLQDRDDRNRNAHDRSGQRDNTDDLKDQDDRKRDAHDRSGQRDRSREYREDERYRRRRSPYGGRERESLAKDKSDHSRKNDGARRRDRRDETEYDKRHSDDVDHRDKRDDREYDLRRENDLGQRDWREGKEYEKRGHDDADRRNDRDSRKRSADDVRGSHSHRPHAGHRDSKRADRAESYSQRMTDIDARKGRGEERDREKRSLNGDLDCDRDRDRGRRH